MICESDFFGIAVAIAKKCAEVRLCLIFVPFGFQEQSTVCAKFSCIISIVLR